MRVVGTVDAVIATVRAEADAEVERLRASADQQLAALAALPPELPPPDRDARLNAARRSNEERLAQVEWEQRRRIIEQREQWMQRVIARGNELLATQDRKETLRRLLDEALKSIGATDVELTVAPGDGALLDVPFPLATGPLGGGCIVRRGGVVFDNSFEARSKRLEPVWRNALAAMYRV